MTRQGRPRFGPMWLALVVGMAGGTASLDAQVVGGLVIGDGDRQPVVGAAVSLLSSSGAVTGRAFTTTNGEFRLRVLSDGWYRLHVASAGFADTIVGMMALRTDRPAVCASRCASPDSRSASFMSEERTVIHFATQSNSYPADSGPCGVINIRTRR